MEWKDNKITELKGINYISTIINNAGCIFNKVDGTNDVGIDGYIEFIDNKSTTGLCIGVQVKSGDSNINAGNANLKSDKEHFTYWKNHILPICGIVYIPSHEKAYWVDIKSYIEENPNILNDGPYRIALDASAEFNLETFSSFHRHFKTYKNTYSTDANFGKALKLLASNVAESRFSGLIALFSFHRNEKESWFYIIHHFIKEKDNGIQKYLIYLMSLIVGHPDIYWHEKNIISEEVRWYAHKVIQQSFTQQETKLLLVNIGENGIDRGTIGQGIHAIIGAIPNRIEFLKNIIMKDDATNEARAQAAIIITYELQFYDRDRAIRFCESMIEHFPDSEYTESFEIIKEQIQLHGEFAIY
jgi:hypothetical protein